MVSQELGLSVPERFVGAGLLYKFAEMLEKKQLMAARFFLEQDPGIVWVFKKRRSTLRRFERSKETKLLASPVLVGKLYYACVFYYGLNLYNWLNPGSMAMGQNEGTQTNRQLFM